MGVEFGQLLVNTTSQLRSCSMDSTISSEGVEWVGILMKDGRPISGVAARQLPRFLSIRYSCSTNKRKTGKMGVHSGMNCRSHIPLQNYAQMCRNNKPAGLHVFDPLSKLREMEIGIQALPYFDVIEWPSRGDQQREWLKFLDYIYRYCRVAHIYVSRWELLILPPESPPSLSGEATKSLRIRYRPSTIPPFVYKAGRPPPLNIPQPNRAHPASAKHVAATSPPTPLWTSPVTPALLVAHTASEGIVAEKENPARGGTHANVALVHPMFLKSVELIHTDWAFGGLAELIDNARDAGAKRLDVSIEEVRWPAQKRTLPVLQVTDNGYGMTHEDIVRMLSFGHDSPGEDNINQIGRFGVGFKAGTMRVGDDVLVLTQSCETRSLGFLSKSYNKGRDELTVPIVTYRNYDGSMELDTSIHTDADEISTFKAVEMFSPFNKFRIGSEFDKIGKDATGTRIFVYNLKTWGGSKSLFEWESGGEQVEDGYKKGDIMIQGKRVRSRNGQTSHKVPLDYSLRAYVEVMFLVPNMSIYVQGSRVRTVRLADDLHQTKRYRGVVLGKKVLLTLGFRQTEYARGNCGIFLYWHRRLINSYARVGRMVHNADYGRGVIGVIDVTELMDFGDGGVGVLANKQGFQDCEQYDSLEKWLAEKVHEYCDSEDNFEVLNPTDIAHEISKGVNLVADQEWVQCDKCQQWRSLPLGITANDLPDEWFCYMEPFEGKCEMPEENVGSDIVTLTVKRGNPAAASQLAAGSDQSGVAHTENVSEESSGFENSKEPHQLTSKVLRLTFRGKEATQEPAKVIQTGVKTETKEAQKRVLNGGRNSLKEFPLSRAATVSKPGGKTAVAAKACETAKSETSDPEDGEGQRVKRVKRGGQGSFVPR